MTKLDEPATKGDIAELEIKFDKKLDELRQDIDNKFVTFADEIKRHFDVVDENMHHDYRGARCDEVEILRDHDKDHERRIARLERSAGLVVA